MLLRRGPHGPGRKQWCYLLVIVPAAVPGVPREQAILRARETMGWLGLYQARVWGEGWHKAGFRKQQAWEGSPC